MRRSTKRLLRIFGLVGGVILILGIFLQQYTFVDTAYFGTVSCPKATGCTYAQLNQCNSEAAEKKVEGWTCYTPCQIYCSNTNEMRTLSTNIYRPAGFACTYFEGGGALVEAKVKCVKQEPKSHAKALCAKGGVSVFTSPALEDKDGDEYPTGRIFEGADIYWFNEFDKAEEKKEDCAYACEQVSDFNAVCRSRPEDTQYVAKDHKGCYAISNRWELWWFNNKNELTERIQICSGLCKDGACVVETAPTASCEYGSCKDPVSYTCADGSVIVAYDCVSGCAVPTTNSCADDMVPVTSFCAVYQTQSASGECVLDYGRLLTAAGMKAYIKDHSVAVALAAGITLIVVTLLLTKRKRGF